jgi:hypothetical protein
MQTNLSTPPAISVMANHLAEVTVELFATYGLSVRASTSPARTSTAPGEPSGVAMIGYVGERVRGALVMIASETAVARWMEAAGASEGDLGDALGEFSNMLLGRLKGRLLSAGLPILLATPTTILGNGLRLSIPPPQSTWQSFDGPGWTVVTRLDATFEPGFVFTGAVGERPAEAGEGILF